MGHQATGVHSMAPMRMAFGGHTVEIGWVGVVNAIPTYAPM